jgi:hypothetical protein
MENSHIGDEVLATSPSELKSAKSLQNSAEDRCAVQKWTIMVELKGRGPYDVDM